MAILSVNAGSSSLKFAVYPSQGKEILPVVLSGVFQGLEPSGRPNLKYHFNGQTHTAQLNPGEVDPFICALQELKALVLRSPGLPDIQAVAHRIVHGGAKYAQTVLASPEILDQLSQLNSLAPLHQPHNLQGVLAFQKVFPHTPQVLCFDTAFHQTVGALESSFALPKALTDQNVRRYGFHGLSYQFIMGTLQTHSLRANGRVIMAHLGNGASLCAASEGKSIATTMGFSALDGLMMGTRSGNLDAGVLLYLLEQGYSHDQLQDLLYKKSGLLGVSTLSADMRELRAQTNDLASKAISLFTHRIVRESGAMVACLEGLDVLAFSGGIGEHDAKLRSEVCKKMSWLGVKIDEGMNQIATEDKVTPISSPESTVEIWVIPTDEGMVSAREAVNLLA
jgi:acetate kinase